MPLGLFLNPPIFLFLRDSHPPLSPNNFFLSSALKESLLSYLGEIALHWVVVIGVSMAVSAALKSGLAQPQQQATSDPISTSGGDGRGEL